jgi:hypothetical protein
VTKTSSKRNTKEPDSDTWTKEGIYKGLLQAIYEEGLENGRLITPDGAMQKLLKIASPSNKGNTDGQTPELSRLNSASLMFIANLNREHPR